MSSKNNIKQTIKASILRWMTQKKVSKIINTPKNILFLRYDRIGDMIITTPVFREFKKAYPNTKIYVLASKTNSEIIKFNPHIDRIFLNHKYSFFKDIPTLLKLRRLKIDIAIEFDHSVVPHAIFRLKIINPKRIFSVRKDGRYGVSGEELKLYDQYSNKKHDEHARDVWLRTIKSLTGKVTDRNYEIFLNEASKYKSEQFIKEINSEFYVGFNLEGAVKGKRISFSDFEELADHIRKILPNAKVILFCHPKKRDQLNKKIKISKLTNVSLSYPTFSLIDLSALVMKMNLIITPDTSVVHIASAFNIPVISIHENNLDSFKLFMPQSSISRTVFSEESDSLSGFKISEIVRFFEEIISILGK